MFDYINGIIVKSLINYVVIDINGLGYKIYVANPYKYKEGEKYTIFLYNNVKEEENSLYGFSSEEERTLFLRLIDVKGLGIKTAISILATSSINGIVDAIDRENILYLKKFPKVGEKLARQMILDLKGKLVSSEVNDNTNEELVMALESLGYKKADIKSVIVQVDSMLPIESQIKEALKLLLK